jgi:hypothetical protein
MRPPSFKSPAAEEPDGPASTPLGVQILSFLCGLLVAVLGFKSAWKDWGHIDKLTHLEAFVETPGKLLKVQVRRDSSGSGEYYPDILFEYFVEGRSIWGWRLSYEDEPRPEAYWRERLAPYAEGKTVPVYYNPSDPKDSIVEKRRDSLYRVAMKMALGVLFLAAGVLLAVLPASSWIGAGKGLRR